MSDLLQQLDNLRAEASTALAQTNSTEASEAWYREYLGRQGKLTGMLRGLGQLSKEERPVAGQVANTVKVTLETALQARQEQIKQIEIERALSAEGIDVTLPGRPTNGWQAAPYHRHDARNSRHLWPDGFPSLRRPRGGDRRLQLRPAQLFARPPGA